MRCTINCQRPGGSPLESMGKVISSRCPITLFAVYTSLFAAVNLLRAAVIFSNKYPTITPVIVFAGTKWDKFSFLKGGLA